MNPTVTSFVFTPFYSLGEYSGGIGSLIICFIPRILVGVAPYWVYRLVKRLRVKDGISQLGLMLAGIAGSLVNTLLVMNLIFPVFSVTPMRRQTRWHPQRFTDSFWESSASTGFRRLSLRLS